VKDFNDFVKQVLNTEFWDHILEYLALEARAHGFRNRSDELCTVSKHRELGLLLVCVWSVVPEILLEIKVYGLGKSLPFAKQLLILLVRPVEKIDECGDKLGEGLVKLKV
jgi:hypothetical protein